MKQIIAMMLAVMLTIGIAGCGGFTTEETEVPSNVNLADVYSEISGTLPNMMLMDADGMMNFYGVDAALCDQYVLAICAEGLRADEVWLIEAKDDAALKELVAMAESRLTAKEDETISYTPDQYEVVKEAELYTSGRFLIFLVSPDVDTLKSTVDAAIN